jgi:hypothetical protein
MYIRIKVGLFTITMCPKLHYGKTAFLPDAHDRDRSLKDKLTNHHDEDVLFAVSIPLNRVSSFPLRDK